MEIKIVFEIEKESRDVIDRFGNALLNLGNTTNIIQSAAEDAIGRTLNPGHGENHPDTNDVNDVSEKKAKKAATVKKEEEPQTPLKEEPKQEVPKEPKKTEPVPTVNVEYTRADLARVGRELAQSGKRDDVLKAFTKFHAMSLADVKPEDFNALAQIYIELGGKF